MWRVPPVLPCHPTIDESIMRSKGSLDEIQQGGSPVQKSLPPLYFIIVIYICEHEWRTRVFVSFLSEVQDRYILSPALYRMILSRPRALSRFATSHRVDLVRTSAKKASAGQDHTWHVMPCIGHAPTACFLPCIAVLCEAMNVRVTSMGTDNTSSEGFIMWRRTYPPLFCMDPQILQRQHRLRSLRR